MRGGKWEICLVVAPTTLPVTMPSTRQQKRSATSTEKMGFLFRQPTTPSNSALANSHTSIALSPRTIGSSQPGLFVPSMLPAPGAWRNRNGGERGCVVRVNSRTQPRARAGGRRGGVQLGPDVADKLQLGNLLKAGARAADGNHQQLVKTTNVRLWEGISFPHKQITLPPRRDHQHCRTTPRHTRPATAEPW